MQYLNLNLSDLDSAEFKGCEPVDRATWICLLRYCAGQENGGTIEGCFGWKDRQWQQVCGVTLEEVKRTCDLWSWKGENLEVRFYPDSLEAEIRAKRKAARSTNKTRWNKRTPTNPKPSESLSESLSESQVSKEVSKVREVSEATSLAEVPSVEEVVTYGASVLSDQIPESFCRHYHEQKEIKRTWQNGSGILIDWRREVRSWWTKDRHTWSTTKANPKSVRSQFCIPNI